MRDIVSSGAPLRGIERLAVFNRLRAAFGLHWELPPLLDHLTAPDGARCLEIGTGLGWGSVGLLRRNGSFTVVATDFEAAILRRSRRFIRGRQPDAHIAYAQADAKSLPFASGCFDVVLSLYVLHHVIGYRAALDEMWRTLRPGGSLLLIDLMRPRFLPQLPASVAPEGVLTAVEWRTLLDSCGFQVDHWRPRYSLGPLPRCTAVARKR